MIKNGCHKGIEQTGVVKERASDGKSNGYQNKSK